jgi:sugar/nucleoside kinase (ribokinase family)
LPKELFREVGGGAAITACGLAKLGGYVGTLAMVGQTDGDWFTKRLEDCGVSTALIHREANLATGTTVSVSTSQDRSFFTYSGANTGLTKLLKEKAIRRELSRANIVHFACPLAPELLSELTDLIHAANHKVSIDVGWHPEWLTSKASWEALKKSRCIFPKRARSRIDDGGESAPEAMLKKFADAGFSRCCLETRRSGFDGFVGWEDYSLPAAHGFSN